MMQVVQLILVFVVVFVFVAVVLLLLYYDRHPQASSPSVHNYSCCLYDDGMFMW